ncbi:MAG: phosphoribosylanthranilate isomerase [Endozoicomonadaceae bacterium]|nr:phosphoribosylanthranilate isomerase [Endozoicomonadaceae bacterium]
MLFNTSPEKTTPIKVKICGLKEVETALYCAEQGVDAIGLMFYPHSHRFIPVTTAQRIASAVSQRTDVIGVFVNPSTEEVTKVMAEVPLTGLQFHGDESVEFCRQWSLPWLKAIRVGNQDNLQKELTIWQQAFACILDATQPGLYGGSGKTFNWSLIPKKQQSSIILAGGLNAENVAKAMIQVAPFALDISSGAENTDGNKSKQKIHRLMQEINSVRYKNCS